MGIDTQNKLGAIGALPGFINNDIDRATSLFDIGTQQREIGVSQFEAELAEITRQEQIKQFLLELMFRGGVSPTFGVTGGFPLPTAGDTGGGLVGGLLDF